MGQGHGAAGNSEILDASIAEFETTLLPESA